VEVDSIQSKVGVESFASWGGWGGGGGLYFQGKKILFIS